jgi:hypothetical protein
LRLISTLFGSGSPSASSEYCMFLRHPSTPTSSPRAFRHLFFRSFDPAWTSLCSRLDCGGVLAQCKNSSG